VLMYNVVEFDEKIYHQVWGVSMGSKCSPIFADLFMAALEEDFMNSLPGRLREKIGFYKRYLDDIFIIWLGNEQEYQEFFQLLNGHHRNIKFTTTPDFVNQTTSFLDVSVKISNGIIKTDLFIKETAVNQYLSPLSCHPNSVGRNIPYSLAFRIKRICSEDFDFERQLVKLKGMLMDRGYRERIVDNAFNRVRALTREHTLEKVVKEPSEKLTFVITYDPRLPPIPSVVHKHARTLMMDNQMKDTFEAGFQIAFKRYRNVKEYLCRAKLYQTGSRRNESRTSTTKGWRKCERCITCSRSSNITRFKSSATGETFEVAERITCKTSNVVYIIECTRCHKRFQYVGKTSRCLMDRGREHVNAIEKGKQDGSAGKMYNHFMSNGHSSRDMLIYAIEIVHGDVVTTGVRERYWINKLDTIRNGLNTYKT